MARRQKQALSKGGPGAPFAVRVVEVGAVKLATIDEDHVAWTPKFSPLMLFQAIQRGAGNEWVGAIVRMRPPPGLDQAKVEAVRKMFINAGVARIKLETRRGATLPNEAVQKAKPSRATVVEVVRLLVKEANSSDAAALSALVETTMAAQGL